MRVSLAVPEQAPHVTCTWEEFIKENDFSPEEQTMMLFFLAENRDYHIGGGAAQEFILRRVPE